MRVVPFDGGGAERGLEVFGIDQILPGGFVAFAVVGQAELPRDIADQFAAVRVAGEFTALIGERERFDRVAIALFVVLGHGKKELPFFIPQSGLQAPLQTVGRGTEFFGRRAIAGQLRDPRDGHRVGPHVAVERRAVTGAAAQNVRSLAAGDIELHAVVVADLPEHAHLGYELPLFPGGEVPHQIGQQVPGELGVVLHQMHRPDRVGQPGAVVARLSARSAKPVPRIVLGHARAGEANGPRTTDGRQGN